MQLLDLTKRNRLLNCKASKQTLPIYSHNPAELEDILAASVQLKLIAMPKLMDGLDPRSKELFEQRHGKEAQKEYAERALSKKDLLVALEEQEMNARLIELYRQSQT